MNLYNLVLIKCYFLQSTTGVKLQRMLLVKSKFKKPANRTKAVMKEAAEMLTPSEQLDLLFNKVLTEEVIKESPEEDLDLDTVDHEDA